MYISYIIYEYLTYTKRMIYTPYSIVYKCMLYTFINSCAVMLAYTQFITIHVCRHKPHI